MVEEVLSDEDVPIVQTEEMPDVQIEEVFDNEGKLMFFFPNSTSLFRTFVLMLEIVFFTN